jgi:hypothetical protein
MGYGSQGRAISGVFEDLRFRPDSMINGFFGDRRLVYYEGQDRFHVDVFLDKLEFSHDILFGKRPGNGRPTWSSKSCRFIGLAAKISWTSS